MEIGLQWKNIMELVVVINIVKTGNGLMDNTSSVKNMGQNFERLCV